MKKLYTLICYVIIQNISLAQSPTIVWTNTFTYGVSDNYTHDIALDSQHNIITGGRFETYQKPNPTIRGSFTNKVDLNGNVIWSDTISPARIDGITINLNDLYTIGSSITKKNLNNVIVWRKNIVGLGITYLNNAIYAVGDHFYKYDLSGNLIWTRQLGMWGAIQIKTSMNYLYVRVGDGNSINPCIIHKYDTLGNLIWSQPSGMGYIWNMTTDENGNSYLIGGSMSRKFNSLGVIDWTIHSDSLAWYNAMISNDTVYICGLTGKEEIPGNSSIRRSSISLFNAQTGAFISNHYIDIFPSVAEQANFILKDGSNIYLSGAGGYQMATLCLAKISLQNISTSIQEKSDKQTLTVYPNPTQGFFQIEYVSLIKGMLQINITDANGKIVYTQAVTKFEGEFKTSVDLSKEAKGVYFFEIIADKNRELKKVVLE
jgi:hypothetical protein